MSEMNNTLGGINNRTDIAEGRVSGLEGEASSESETQKTRPKISEQHSREL